MSVLNIVVFISLFMLTCAQVHKDQSLFKRAGLPPNVDLNEEPPAEEGDGSNHSPLVSSHETGPNSVIPKKDKNVSILHKSVLLILTFVSLL